MSDLESLRGNLDAVRDLKGRYTQFVHDLWRFGISHLDFSMLNVGITGSGQGERLQLFDPQFVVYGDALSSFVDMLTIDEDSPGHDQRLRLRAGVAEPALDESDERLIREVCVVLAHRPSDPPRDGRIGQR